MNQSGSNMNSVRFMMKTQKYSFWEVYLHQNQESRAFTTAILKTDFGKFWLMCWEKLFLEP